MTRLDDKKWCVVSGNPVDGIKIHGTFANHQDASDWAEREFDNTCDQWKAGEPERWNTNDK